MRKHYVVESGLLSFAHKTIETTDNADNLRRALCVVLSNDWGFTANDIATLLKIGRRTVFRYRDEIYDIYSENEDPRNNWGGRRTSILTESEEHKFLENFKDKALKGELIDVKLIHNSLIEHVGRQVSLASTYNLLERNGWRKLTPNKCHPKSDSSVQEEFKKKCQKYWSPLSKHPI
jgi:transposase